MKLSDEQIKSFNHMDEDVQSYLDFREWTRPIGITPAGIRTTLIKPIFFEDVDDEMFLQLVQEVHTHLKKSGQSNFYEINKAVEDHLKEDFGWKVIKKVKYALYVLV